MIGSQSKRLTVANTQWPDNLPPLGPDPLPEFPVDVLPDVLRDWVHAESVATQTPLHLAGLLSLASWHDHAGKRHTKCVRTTDKATAERIARKLETDAALRRDGVIDPALDAISRESGRSIESHLTDYEAKLRAANRTEKYVTSTMRFIRWIAEYAGFQTAADIRAEGVTRYASALRDAGRAARTIQAQ